MVVVTEMEEVMREALVLLANLREQDPVAFRAFAAKFRLAIQDDDEMSSK